MSSATKTATRYIELVGAHDLAPFDELFADDLVATTAGRTFGKDEWITALARLLPVVVRNDIRESFGDDHRAVVIYDFVTDTDSGAVRCVEWITVRGGQITTIELIFDRSNWAYVAEALQARAAAG